MQDARKPQGTEPQRQQRAAAEAQEDASLPWLVVDRNAPAVPSSRVTILWRVARRVRFLPFLLGCVALGCVALGGVIGLYFQPPGLQFMMRSLDLEPGAGSSSPMAVPPAANVAASAGPAFAVYQPGNVVGLGTLLPARRVLTIGFPHGAGDARIAELRIDEGAEVEKGEVLAVLDSEAQFEAAVEASRANVAVSEAALGQTRVSAKANLEAAQAELQRARSDLVTAFVRAPITGTILDIRARVGERPHEDGLLTMADLDEMVAEVEVYQSDIRAVAEGDAVMLEAKALPEPLSGVFAGALGMCTLSGAIATRKLADADPADLF